MLPSHASTEANNYTHHQANLMVCVVVARPLLYREVCRARGGTGVERPCAMIFTLLGL